MCFLIVTGMRTLLTFPYDLRRKGWKNNKDDNEVSPELLFLI
jgi:hypothetical protein